MPSNTFETPGQLRLLLAIPAGEIDIDTTPGDSTQVELEALTESARELLEDARIERRDRGAGHEVLIEVPTARSGFFISFGRGPEFRLRVTCPPGADLDVQTKSADVHARGEYRSVVVKTASGDVDVDEAHVDARIKTASGDVHLGTVHGVVDVHTASGDLAIQRASGPVNAQLVSGDAWIRDAGASVSVNTVSGDQRVDAVSEGAVDLHTVSGDVHVGVRRGSRVFVDCNTISGDTSSELELGDAPPGTGADGPLVEVRAKTVSGDIQLVRAPASLPTGS